MFYSTCVVFDNAKILILKLITTYEMVSVVLCRFIYTLSAYFNEYIHVLQLIIEGEIHFYCNFVLCLGHWRS